MSGYGRGFQEDKAVSRIDRFKQYLREPISKADVWIGLSACPIAVLLIILLATVYLDGHL